MNKSTFYIMGLLSLFIMACTSEPANDEIALPDPNFNVYDSIRDSGREYEEESAACLTVDLIAGQHHVAGSITVENIDGLLTLTYTTDPGWTIEATHLSIGDCSEQSFPTTGSGNPKVGHFEHSTEHPDGTNEVVYTLDVEVLLGEFCFAAHAEVTSPEGDGETAWGEGIDFGGNSWAMYVEALLFGCDAGGTGDEDPDQPVVK